MKKQLLFILIAIGFFHVNTAHAQCTPPSGVTHPNEGEFVQDQWTAYAYNISSYDDTNFDYSDYRGYYIDDGYDFGNLSFDSRDHWGVSSSPSTTSNTTYEGCSVTDNFHVISYKRKGFTPGAYQLNINGRNNADGHDDSAKLIINGVEVWSDNSCCDTHNDVWSGNLDQNDEIEFVWSEREGRSYGAVEFESLTPDPVTFGQDLWHVAVFNDNNLAEYAGYYTENTLDFDTNTLWGGTNSPSDAPGYIGNQVSDEDHGFIYRREGFLCGYYQLDILKHDDDVVLTIDGTIVYQQNTWDNETPTPDVWQGFLGPTSKIEFSIQEDGGVSVGALSFNKLHAGNPNDVVWTGAVSSNTSDSANWCPGTPGASSNVYIPPSTLTTFDPVVNSSGVINSLTIAQGAIVDLRLHSVEISDYLINEGTLVDDKINDLKLTGNAAYISGNGFEINTLTSEGLNVSLDLDAGEEMRVLDVLEIPLGSFETNNQLVLGCQLTDLSQRVGQIGDLSSGSITGEVATEQCIPGRRAYRFVSAPVSTTTSIHANWQENATAWNNDPQPGYGTHITGSLTDQTNGFDMTTSGNPSLFVFDNSSQAWNAIDNTDVNTLDAGTPYRLLVRGDRSTDITLNTAAATPTILRTKGDVTSGVVNLAAGFDATNGSFNFFGNPYPAAIDMSEVMQSASALQEDYYVWDPTLGGAADANSDPNNLGGRGGFVTVDLEAGAGMGTNSAGSAANQYLQPGQAAFVKVNTAGTPQMLLNESNKNVTADQTATFSSGGISSIDLTLFKASDLAAGETARDGARLKFSEAYTTPVSTEDASKFGNLDENIAIANADDYLAIDRRAFPENDEIIPLFLNQYRANNYSLRIQMNEMDGYEFFITDAYLEEETQISDGFVFDFEVDANVSGSIDENRFALAMKPVTLGQEDITSEDWRMYPNPLEANTLTIDVPNALQGKFNVKVYDVLGHYVLDHEQDAENNRIELSNLNLSAGVYIVKITSDQEQASFVKKLIVK